MAPQLSAERFVGIRPDRVCADGGWHYLDNHPDRRNGRGKLQAAGGPGSKIHIQRPSGEAYGDKREGGNRFDERSYGQPVMDGQPGRQYGAGKEEVEGDRQAVARLFKQYR